MISFDRERVKIFFSEIFIAIFANKLSVDLKKAQFSLKKESTKIEPFPFLDN